MVINEIRPVVDAIYQLQSGGTLVCVAVDGHSGVGKSTLSSAIANSIGGVYVDQDDFYAGGDVQTWSSLDPDLRWKRCIDWKRVRHELLAPLRAGRGARYSPFDWEAMTRSSGTETHIEPADVVVLDGTYSSRPELLDLIDLTVLVTLNGSARTQRLRQREGDDWSADWFSMWDEAEDVYFETVRPASSFDIVIHGEP